MHDDSRIETRPLAAADIDGAATALGLALADYPWTRWVVDADDHVEQRHLYLGTTGTTPVMQRRGLATRTLAPGLAFADRENITACLETSTHTNVEFYSRLGFSVVHHWCVANGIGPDVWTMQRAPRPPLDS